MAEKHKSKYKKPENTKYKSRKDLKDYTTDDKDGALNPYSTKQKQNNVLRKTDKTVQDDGKYDVKYNADDRLYKDLEDGEYDAKHAAKVFKKRQDKEEKDVSDVLKDKVENLTREQRERLVREYVRRKIVKMLVEQPTPADAPAEEKPEEETPAPEGGTPAPPAGGGSEPSLGAPGGATPPAGGATPPTTGATPPTAPATPPAGETTPGAETPPAEKEETPEDKAQEKIAKQKLALKYWEETLADQSGPNMLVDTGFDPLGKALSALGAKDLKLAKMMILRRLAKIKPAAATTEKTK
jgi:hypothetical protein